MAKNKNNDASKPKKNEKQDIYISDETIELEKNPEVKSSAEETEEKDESFFEESELENAIDVAVKEYNGEIKGKKIEENQISIREKADVARITKTNKKTIVITLSIIFALLISFIALAVVNKMNSNVYRNIYLGNKDLTGMTSAEVSDHIKTEQEKISKQTLKIFQGNEKILEIMPTDIDFEIDNAVTQENIFGFGRNSNVLKNNIDIFYALITKKEFEYVYKYNVTKLSDIVKEIKESLDNKVVNDSYVIDEKQYKLIITRGKSGNTIEEVEVKDKIISSFAAGKEEYTLEIIKGMPTELDVDVVYSKVRRDAEDAYIDKTMAVYKFVPHKVGLDFNKDDLSKILADEENKKEEKVIEFNLDVIQPKIKMSDINWESYDYKISSYTTYFSTSDQNRVTNLKVALNLINGKVIMPGETFSYNSAVGGATEAQGFKAASTFVGGRIVKEVGGGICQTVSTLYNTALLANLEIVQRKAHSLPVAYVPGSRDATVYYPSIDFKFKNTRQYPIKIVTSFNSGGNLTISLFGTKQENEYVVSISSRTLSTIPYKTEYINDASLEKGVQQVVQNGTNGYTSESYVTKKLNGKIVSNEFLSKDTYKAVNKIVRIGTKEVYVAPKPTVPSTNNTENNTNQNISGETTVTPEASTNIN